VKSQLSNFWHYNETKKNKKFELILARRAKAYSSSCSQTVSQSPVILCELQLKIAKINKNPLF